MQINIELSYNASGKGGNIVNFYDVSQALVGFQRTLALTTHLILNDKIIVQAPHLKGAEIYTSPSENGSFRIIGIITTIGAGMIALNQQPKDTPLGHLWHSAYDYVISETLGFHVDYNLTIGKQLEDSRQSKSVSETSLDALKRERLDSLCEKCELAIEMMHRPIYASKTASLGLLSINVGGSIKNIGQPMNMDTYENIRIERLSDKVRIYRCKVASYNSNLFTGRIFIAEYNRLIPFILDENFRTKEYISLLTENLHKNAAEKFLANFWLNIHCYEYLSRTDIVKKILIVSVSE